MRFGMRMGMTADGPLSWLHPSLRAHSPAYVYDIGKARLARTIVAAADVGTASAAALATLVNAGEAEAWANFTRSTTGTYITSGGLVATAAINAPRLDYTNSVRQMLLEAAATNKCANFNAAPAGTTQISAFNGATVAAVTVASAPSAVRAAIQARTELVTSLIRLQGDNLSGVNITGGSGNTNAHVLSVRAYTVTGAGTLTTDLNADPQPLSASFGRTSLALGSVGATVRLRVRIEADGTDIYFCLNQMEEGAAASSEIIVAGSAVTRTADDFAIDDLLEALRVDGFKVRAWPNGATPDTVSSDTIANGKRYDLVAAFPAAEDISDIEALTYAQL